eukprot:gene1560-1702_t
MADNNDCEIFDQLFDFLDEKKEVENLSLENSDVKVHLMEEEEKQRMSMMEKENDENQPLTIMNAQNQLLEEKKDENQPKQNSLWYNPVYSAAKMTVDAIGVTNARMAVGSATGTVGGAAVGVAVVGGALIMVGLGPLGPVAGGWFAANMGAGLATGSVMSLAQSAAMTGAAYSLGATAGGVVGAATGAAIGAVTAPADKKQQ